MTLLKQLDIEDSLILKIIISFYNSSKGSEKWNYRQLTLIIHGIGMNQEIQMSFGGMPRKPGYIPSNGVIVQE